MNKISFLHALPCAYSQDIDSIEQRGYRCYDPIARRLRISRNVIFFENIPFSKISYFDSSISAKTSASLDIPNSLFLEMNVNHVPSEHDISSAPTDSNETSQEAVLKLVQVEPRYL